MELKNELSKYKENDKITLQVLRNNKIIDCYSNVIVKGTQATGSFCGYIFDQEGKSDLEDWTSCRKDYV